MPQTYLQISHAKHKHCKTNAAIFDCVFVHHSIYSWNTSERKHLFWCQPAIWGFDCFTKTKEYKHTAPPKLCTLVL